MYSANLARIVSCLTGVLWFAIAGSGNAAGNGGLRFGDCSANSIAVLEARLFDDFGNLRPMFFSRDLAHLSICAGSAGSPKLLNLEERLNISRDVARLRACGSKYPTDEEDSRARKVLKASDYVVECIRAEISEGSTNPLHAAALDACNEKSPCDAEVVRRMDFELPQKHGISLFAKSGGLPFARFLGHAGKAGHYEITARALAAYAKRFDGQAFSAKATAVITDAARDADFYDWTTPAAHGQTLNDDKSAELVDSQSVAQGKFIDWVRVQFRQAFGLCTQGRARDALYMIGYGLHGIQDLVFHEGISNAEHSWLDFEKDVQVDAVDHYDDKMALATTASVKSLDFLREKLDGKVPGNCWERMTALSGAGELSSQEKLALLAPRKGDFGVLAYFAYKDLSTIMNDGMNVESKPESSFRIPQKWLQERTPKLLDQYLATIFGNL